MAEVDQILQELKGIRKDLRYIKEHMVDVDMIITPKEEARIEQALKEYKEGKTTSLKDVKLELGL